MPTIMRKVGAAALCSLLLITVVYAKDATDWPAIKAELDAMLKADQTLRLESNEMLADARAKGVDVDQVAQKQIWSKINVQDRANQKRLTELVDLHGWPKQSVVGMSAAMAAFLIVQHAEELDYQLKYIETIREATQTGEASKGSFALLEDRVLLRQDKPQRYGSQVETQGGVSLRPTVDEANLNVRRATMGMEPICEYLGRFTQTHGKIIYPPCVKSSTNEK